MHFKPLHPISQPEPKLQHVSYILYPIQIEQQLAKALINSNNEVNTMNSDFTIKFGIQIYETKVDAQKIDGLKLDIFDIVIASFFIENKERESCFFKKKIPIG